MIPGSSVAIVAIGRNEGERLKACLRAAGVSCPRLFLPGRADRRLRRFRIVRRQCGLCAQCGLPRGRVGRVAALYGGAGAERRICLRDQSAPDTEFVQFVDGDCELEQGWIEAAVAALTGKVDAGLVCGHVREIHPAASVFNRLCDLEWRQAPGEILTAGGRFMARARAFKEVGGFRPDVIAAEDDEFCIRVRQKGWKILKIDAPMARHDVAIASFSQWWRRTRRSGHAYAQVAALHGGGEERYFVRDRRRILVWGLALPVIAVVLAPFTRGISLVALLCLYALQLIHIARGCRKRGWATRDAWTYGFFTVISRFPALQGLLEYYWRRLRGRAMTIIEYK